MWVTKDAFSQLSYFTSLDTEAQILLKSIKIDRKRDEWPLFCRRIMKKCVLMLGEFTSERLLIEFEGMKTVLSQTARVVKVCADLF